MPLARMLAIIEEERQDQEKLAWEEYQEECKEEQETWRSMEVAGERVSRAVAARAAEAAAAVECGDYVSPHQKRVQAAEARIAAAYAKLPPGSGQLADAAWVDSARGAEGLETYAVEREATADYLEQKLPRSLYDEEPDLDTVEDYDSWYKKKTSLESWMSGMTERILRERKEREAHTQTAKEWEAKEAKEAKEAEDNAAIREFLRKNAEEREEAVHTFLETASKDDMETLVDELDMPDALDAIATKAKNILHDRWRKKRLSKSAVVAVQQKAFVAERAALAAERTALAAERAALVAERAILVMERDVLTEKDSRTRVTAKERAKAKAKAKNLRNQWDDLGSLKEDT